MLNALGKALHERALYLSRHYHRIEGELLEVLLKIDEKRIYLDFGYHSLFQYAVSELKLSEASAFNFISVARKSREVPELKEEIKAGNLSVSTARKITPVIKPENALEWIEKAKTLPKPKLEQAVAKILPQTLTPEKAKYVTEKRIAVQMGLDEKVFEQLKRVQDLLSQKLKKPAKLEDAVAAMAEFYLEKHDPVVKAERVLERKKPIVQDANMPVPGTGELARNPEPTLTHGQERGIRKPVPARVKHEVFLRDLGQCSFEHEASGRCREKRWLDIHHKTPVASGGLNTTENLQLLCFGHHRVVHQDAGGV